MAPRAARRCACARPYPEERCSRRAARGARERRRERSSVGFDQATHQLNERRAQGWPLERVGETGLKVAEAVTSVVAHPFDFDAIAAPPLRDQLRNPVGELDFAVLA